MYSAQSASTLKPILDLTPTINIRPIIDIRSMLDIRPIPNITLPEPCLQSAVL